MRLNSKFKPLFTNQARYFIVTGGRGGGKSVGATTAITLLTEETNHRVLYTRWTMASAELSIIPEFHEKIEWLHKEQQFKILATEIINKRTKSEILFRGIKTSAGNQTANLKSLQGITTWVVDEAEEYVDEKSFNKIDLSIRTKSRQNRIILILNPTTKEHWIWKRFFEKTHRIEMIDGYPVAMSTHPDVCHIHTTYLDNIENLSESFLHEVATIKQNDPRRYGHEIIGGWLMQPEGVLYLESELKRFSMKGDNVPRLSEAAAIYGYGDIADEGTDSLCFPVGYLFKNRVYIPEIVFTDEDITHSLPKVVSCIKAQTYYEPDGKTIKKRFDRARIESNGQGAVFIKMVRQYIEPSKVLPVNHATNKLTRIKLAKRFVVNYCYFLANEDIIPGSDYDKFMKALLSFLKNPPPGSHDDAPDGLSGLAVMCESFSPELFDPLPIEVI